MKKIKRYVTQSFEDRRILGLLTQDAEDLEIKKYTELYKAGFPVVKPLEFRFYEGKVWFCFELPKTDSLNEITDDEIYKFFKKFGKPRNRFLLDDSISNYELNADASFLGAKSEKQSFALYGISRGDIIKSEKDRNLYLIPGSSNVFFGDTDFSVASYYMSLYKNCQALDAIHFLENKQNKCSPKKMRDCLNFIEENFHY